MATKDILLILLPIVTAILSSYLTFYFAIKSKKTEAMIKFKEEKYSNLVVALQGFIGTTVSAEIKRKFFSPSQGLRFGTLQHAARYEFTKNTSEPCIQMTQGPEAETLREKNGI